MHSAHPTRTAQPQRDIYGSAIWTRLESSMKASMLVAAAWVVAAAPTDTVNFDNAPAGGPPAGWTATQTGTGQAKWAVVQDETAPSKPNVLKQSGQATFPVCL